VFIFFGYFGFFLTCKVVFRRNIKKIITKKKKKKEGGGGGGGVQKSVP